jgi:hypothetical protein
LPRWHNLAALTTLLIIVVLVNPAFDHRP